MAFEETKHTLYTPNTRLFSGMFGKTWFSMSFRGLSFGRREAWDALAATLSVLLDHPDAPAEEKNKRRSRRGGRSTHSLLFVSLPQFHKNATPFVDMFLDSPPPPGPPSKTTFSYSGPHQQWVNHNKENNIALLTIPLLIGC